MSPGKGAVSLKFYFRTNIGMQLPDPVRLVAVAFGVLLVLTRLPAVFNPRKFKGIVSKALKKNVKLVGALALLIGAVSLYVIWPEVPLLDILAGFFALALMVFGAVCFIFKEAPLCLAEAVNKKTNTFIRYMAFLGVLVGLAILYIALPQV